MKHMKRVHGKTESVLKSPYFPKPRQNFLAERRRYWENHIAAGKF
jgi:hypothetical protein